MHSGDGDRWERVGDSATQETLDDVALGGDFCGAVGYHGAIEHSSDGVRWQQRAGPRYRLRAPFRIRRPDDDPLRDLFGFGGVAWNGGRVVAVG